LEFKGDQFTNFVESLGLEDLSLENKITDAFGGSKLLTSVTELAVSEALGKITELLFGQKSTKWGLIDGRTKLGRLYKNTIKNKLYDVGEASLIISILQIAYELGCSVATYFFETINDYTDTFYSLSHYLGNSTNFQFDDKDLIFYE
jgi:hypothetical protein